MKKFTEVTEKIKTIRVEETHYDSLSSEEIKQFVDLVDAGGQRVGGTERSLKKANAVFLLRDADNKIVGGSVIKPGDNYEVEDLMDRMGLSYDDEVGKKKLKEFGLSVVDPEYRGNRLIDLLYTARINYVKKNFPNAYCFCTIRNNTVASINAAMRNQFEYVGEYQSLYGKHYLSFFKLVLN